MRSALIRTDRYSSVAIAFHWTIAALVLINLAIGLFHDAMPRGWGVMPIHKAIGITVLVLSLGRLAWRLSHRPPPFAPETAAWERASARLVHASFYVLMIVLPLSGWAMSSYGEPSPRPLTWFGLFDIPYLPVDKAMAGAAGDAHELLGYVMAALLVLHVAAALRHHLILRDATLARMAPILRRPSAS